LNGTTNAIQNPIVTDAVVEVVTTIRQGAAYIATVRQSIDNEAANYHFIVFDQNGNISQTYEHSDLIKRVLHSPAFEYDSVTDGVIVIGSFDYKVSKKDKPKQREINEIEEAESSGLFFLRFSSNEPELSNYVDFKDFKNIYNALTAEELMQVRQQQSRSKNEKAAKPDVSFSLFNAKIVRLDNRYVYVAEAFRPQYRLESRIEYDFYGRPIPYTYSVFEGYNFFTTLAGTFDEHGALSWSYNFEIPELISMHLQPHTLTQPDSANLVFCVINAGLLQSTIIGADGTESGGIEQTKIVSNFSNDRLLEEDFTSVLYWYGPYYIAMGYQKISNNKLRENNPRTIFYINKLGFR